MDAVVLDLWPRLVDSGKMDRSSFSLFVKDASKVLSPKRVTSIDESKLKSPSPLPPPSDTSAKLVLETLPQCDTLLALSDLIHLFRTVKNSTAKAADTPASAKLLFYAAQVATLPLPILPAFGAEVGARACTLEAEGKEAPAMLNAKTAAGPEPHTIAPMNLVQEL